MQVKVDSIPTVLQVKRFIPFVTAYDGEDGNPDPAPTPTPPAPTPKPDDPSLLKMTQAQLDVIVKDRLAREQKKADEALKSKEAELLAKIENTASVYSAEKSQLAQELEEMKGKFQGTEEEKASFQKRISELKNETLTAEEQAAAKIQEIESRLSETENSYKEQLEGITNSYHNYRIENEVRSAAVANGASSPEQLMTILRDKTSLKPKIGEDGKPIPGKDEVKISIDIVDKDKNVKTVELGPVEAFAELRKDVEGWGNQFKSEANPGSGLNNDNENNAPDTGLVTDKGMEAYKKSRETAKGLAARKMSSSGRFVGSISARTPKEKR